MNTEPTYQAYPPALPPTVQYTVITDVQIPFSRLVVLILKYFLAAIPAFICLWMCFAVIGLVLSLFMGGLFQGLKHALENMPPPQH